jgi:hypothetical protein
VFEKDIMSNELDRAVRCRNYAEELRIIAADREAGDNRLALLRAATAYDQMADSMEAILRSRQQVSRAHSG